VAALAADNTKAATEKQLREEGEGKESSKGQGGGEIFRKLGATTQDHLSVAEYRALLESNDPKLKTHAGRIPNVVHRVMFRDPDFPEKDVRFLQEFYSKTQDDFVHVLWRKEDAHKLIEDHFPEFLPVYDGYSKHIQRADTIRYAILAHYGGVYTDVDIELTGSLMDVLANTVPLLDSKGIDFLGPHEITDDDECREAISRYAIRQHLPTAERKPFAWVIANYFMVAAAGSQGARAVLDICVHRAKAPFDANVDYDVLFTTGPDVVTTIVNKRFDMDVVHTTSKEIARNIVHHGRGHWLTNGKDPRPGCYGAV